MIVMTHDAPIDFLIQAAYLRGLNRPSTVFYVPGVLLEEARDLFPAAEIHELPDFSLRLGGDARKDILPWKAHAKRRHGGKGLLELRPLPRQTVRERNQYQVAWELLARRERSRALLEGSEWRPKKALWRPFADLPAWRELARSPGHSPREGAPVSIALVASGPFGAATIERRRLELLAKALERLGHGVEIVPGQLPQRRKLSEIAQGLARFDLVVAPESVEYHVCALSGIRVLALSGPRSIQSFGVPEPGPSVDASLPCVDCSSIGWCVMGRQASCQACADPMSAFRAVGAALGIAPQALRNAETELAAGLWAPKTISAPPESAPLGGTSLDEVEWFKKTILLPLLQTPLHWGYRVTMDSLRRYRFRGREFGARAKRVADYYRKKGLRRGERAR